MSGCPECLDAQKTSWCLENVSEKHTGVQKSPEARKMWGYLSSFLECPEISVPGWPENVLKCTGVWKMCTKMYGSPKNVEPKNVRKSGKCPGVQIFARLFRNVQVSKNVQDYRNVQVSRKYPNIKNVRVSRKCLGVRKMLGCPENVRVCGKSHSVQ